MLRGRRVEADKIEVQGIDEAKLQQAAEAMQGFSGELNPCCGFGGVLEWPMCYSLL